MTSPSRSSPAADRELPRGDRIELRGLRVRGTHGVLPEEKDRDQPFELDLDLDLDLTTAGGTDRLSDTVDYGAVAAEAAALVAGPRSYDLLEALGEAVATAVLGIDRRVAGVTVTVRKLEPPMDLDIESVGVRIIRRR